VVFSSSPFLFGFLPALLVVYHLLVWRRVEQRWLNGLLVLASLGFLAWASPWLPLAIPAVVVMNFGIAQLRRRVPVALVANLAVMLAFHYTAAGEALLPGLVALSFTIFQCLALCKADHGLPFTSYLCGVLFFPTVMAGPLLTAAALAAGVGNRQHSVEAVAAGLTRFTFGLTKKLLLADPLSRMVDLAFGAGDGSLSTFVAWLGALAFALQIYFDLSGYADMAVGLGKMLGFTLPESFESPYRSGSVTEFWRRWHLTLTEFFRSMLYRPLAGASGVARPALALVLTFALVALWHGPRWTFLCWAGVHVLALMAENARGGMAFFSSMPKLLRAVPTFIVVMVGWVFFRAADLESALRYLITMAGMGEHFDSGYVLEKAITRDFNMVMLVVASLAAWMMPNTQFMLKRFTWWKGAIGLLLLLLSVAMLMARGTQPFYYFRF